MKPEENPLTGGAYYPTETDHVNGGCSLSKMNGFYSDARYKNLGMVATEYDIQHYSGVLDTLDRQPLATDTYGWGGSQVAK